ncbi:hypothetical protein [Marinimicrobium agarilyticum]|uniref:hypothetical protein n=1 Tax=Marinimicrobium agarilyticum TaxID=306546 RepID=UPI0012F6E264|nr:hypothetical protein [Marinimicrobium agarilyticum]
MREWLCLRRWGRDSSLFCSLDVGALNHDPNFDIIVGRWGECSNPNAKCGVSIQYRLGSEFMIIDADSRPFATGQTLFANALPRAEVVGTELASQAFSVLDAVWLQDSRLEELRVAANQANHGER